MAVDTQRKTLAEDTDIDAALLKTSAASLSNGSRRGGAAVRGTPRSGEGLKPPKKTMDNQSQESQDARAQQLQDTVSQFIETTEVQAAIVFLIVFDLCSTVLSRHLRMTQELLHLEGLVTKATASSANKNSLVDLPVPTPSPSLLSSVALRLLDSLSGFTIVFFVLELAVLAFTFRRRFLSHFGYLLDLIVVCTSIGMEIYTESQAVRLLGVLRVWRVFRLVGTLLEQERRMRDQTLEELEFEKTRVLQLQYEKQAAEQSLKREFESRAGIERMLQGYKDEADTLREALNIAALAVAEATMQAIPEGVEEAETPATDDVQQGEEFIESEYQKAYYALETTQSEQQQQYETNWTGDDVPTAVNEVEGAGLVERDTLDSDAEDETFTDARDD